MKATERAGDAAPTAADLEDTVSDWTLERLVLGELPAAVADRLRARAALDPVLQARIDAIGADDGRTLAALPPAAQAAAIQRRRHLAKVERVQAERQERWQRGMAFLAPALMAAALALFALQPPAGEGGLASRADDRSEGLGLGGERAKGDDARAPLVLGIYRKRGDALERLRDGAAARRGDLLQVTVRSDRALRCAVVSVDGRGTVTRHLPEAGDVPAPIEAGRPLQPAHAYELDDAPAFERFVLACAKAPFSVDALAAALRAEPAALPTLAGAEVQALTLRKDAVGERAQAEGAGPKPEGVAAPPRERPAAPPTPAGVAP